MARDPKYTDAGQLLRMACNGLTGAVESVHADEANVTCYKVRFRERRIGHSCAFYDREELMTHVHTASDDRIFVFGSNLQGIHGAGAARYACRELDYPPGVGEGLNLRAYALPTCSEPGVPLGLEEVRAAVGRFIATASLMKRIVPVMRFFVSEVGCGFAGFTAEQIAPMFEHAPDNCDLPPGWRKEESNDAA
jgi:hypothetical protein